MKFIKLGFTIVEVSKIIYATLDLKNRTITVLCIQDYKFTNGYDTVDLAIESFDWLSDTLIEFNKAQ